MVCIVFHNFLKLFDPEICELWAIPSVMVASMITPSELLSWYSPAGEKGRAGAGKGEPRGRDPLNPLLGMEQQSSFLSHHSKTTAATDNTHLAKQQTHPLLSNIPSD